MPRVSPRPTGGFLVTLILVACTTATQRAYVAPTYETVVSETEEQGGDVSGQIIYVHNRSTVPVRVSSVTLSSCQNVKQRCGQTRMSIAIPPGNRRAIMRIHPANAFLGFSYFFNFAWHPEGRETLAAIRPADPLEEFDPRPRYKELTLDDFRPIAGRAASLRAEPESLMLAPGEEESIERIRVLVVDAQAQVLGQTRWLRWAIPGQGPVEFRPGGRLTARRPGRAVIRFALADDARAILGHDVPEIEVPVVVAYRVAANAPVFAGRAVDADSGIPLACAPVALEDSLQNAAASGRTDAAGLFQLQAPQPGTYRVRFDIHGWSPSYGPSETAAADEWKEGQYRVRFTEQMLVPRSIQSTGVFEHARPAAVRTEPIPTRSTPGKGTTTPVVSGVTLGGSESMPILGIISRVPEMTTWMQFVVDTAGRVDTTSVVLPPDTPADARASIKSVLPRVRFTPAREEGRPTCELIRMQVNFSPR